MSVLSRLKDSCSGSARQRRSLLGIVSALGAFASLALASESAQAAPPNTMPIWRVQVRFITADVGDAGTDSQVKVDLNGSNRTYLDSGRDDRERNKDESYDLRLDGVNTLADIDYLRIEKSGDDGWAIRRMMLIVNDKVIYDESFSPSPLWLDNEGGASRIRFIDDMFMRPRNEWINYTAPTRPSIVPIGAMNSRSEALWGDYATITSNMGLEETGGLAVVLNTVNLNTWRVHVDLVEDDTWLIGQNVNVNFNLHVGCVNGSPDFTVSDVSASSAFEPYTAEIRSNARNFTKGEFKTRLNELMKGFRYVPYCPNIALAPNGDLYFSRRFPVGDCSVLDFVTQAVLDLNVGTGASGDIRPYEQADFVATVRSQLKEETKAQLVFELPAQIRAYDAVVEALPVGGDKREPRFIKADLKQRDDGTSALQFEEALAVGQVAYTLHVVYEPKQDGKASIVSTIQPLGEAEKLITTLKSETFFSFQKGEVVPEGTETTGSHYMGEEYPWRKPKPTDGR